MTAPFVLLLLVLSVSGSLPGRAEEMSEKTDLFPFAGMTGEAEEGAVLTKAADALILEEGSVLLASRGQVSLGLGDSVTLLGITGGFHATKHGDSLTVAAITTPALLSAPQGSVLIPTGMQWRGRAADLPSLSEGFSAWSTARALTDIPPHFLEEQLKHLKELDDIDALPPVVDALPARPVDDHLLLPAAQERTILAWQDATIGYLRGLLEQGAFAKAEQYLSTQEAKDIFADARVRVFVPALLGSVPSGASFPLSLFTHLASEENLFTVASIHSRYSAYVWTGGDDISSSRETVLLRLLQLPASDRWSEAIPAFVVDKWETSARTFLHVEEDPASALPFFAEKILSVISAAEDREQPERALRYEEALRRILESFETEASSVALQLLTEREKSETNAEAMEAKAVPSEPVSVETPWGISEEDTITQARALLMKAGALMSIQTTITAKELPLLHVEQIVFPTKNGDIAYSFDLDLRRLEIKNIVHGDRTLPFALSVENFVAWIREQ